MSFLALIPARGGSKGILRKNIRHFCGKPLLFWSVKAALETSGIDQVVVSTDDPEIAAVAKAAGADVPFMRPSDLAGDLSSGISVVLHALDQLHSVDDLLLLQPTSPLRTSNDIEAIIKLRMQSKVESAVSVTRCSKHPAWMYSLDDRNYMSAFLPSLQANCRQELSLAYYLNGAMYLATRDFLLCHRSFLGPSTVGYVMPEARSIDIDDEARLDPSRNLF